MERLTHKRCNGIKTGYWSAAKKDELIQRLAMYEDAYSEQMQEMSEQPTGLREEDKQCKR